MLILYECCAAKAVYFLRQSVIVRGDGTEAGTEKEAEEGPDQG